jgi:curved DNA-binding protein
LFLKVRFASHPDYQVEHDDLCYELDLPPWDVVLGATVSVPLLDGRANLKIPPGTRGGQRLRLRGMGMPKGDGKRGDLIVVVSLQVPERIGERERALWEQLRSASGQNPRS